MAVCEEAVRDGRILSPIVSPTEKSLRLEKLLADTSADIPPVQDFEKLKKDLWNKIVGKGLPPDDDGCVISEKANSIRKEDTVTNSIADVKKLMMESKDKKDQLERKEINFRTERSESTASKSTASKESKKNAKAQKPRLSKKLRSLKVVYPHSCKCEFSEFAYILKLIVVSVLN